MKNSINEMELKKNIQDENHIKKKCELIQAYEQVFLPCHF